MLKDICNDIDIRHGIIRQRSNDKSSIFLIDLTTILGVVDLPIINLKQKLDLLKIFNGSPEVQIEFNDTSYAIFDSQSKLIFSNPNLDFIDNKFMTQEELDESLLIDHENTILSVDIPKVIGDRIKIICTSFNVNTIKVHFQEDLASIITKTRSLEQEAVFMKDIKTRETLNCDSNLVIIPFVIDHDENLRFIMYRTTSTPTIAVNKFVTVLGHLPITIYTRSGLNTDGEEEGETTE
jgi:hypothetical protein